MRGYLYSLLLFRFCSGGVRGYFLITSTIASFVLFFHGCCARLFSIIIIIASVSRLRLACTVFLTTITRFCVFAGVVCTVIFLIDTTNTNCVCFSGVACAVIFNYYNDHEFCFSWVVCAVF